MVVAFQAAGRTTDANYYLAQLVKGQKPNGGVPYSLLGTNNGYWTMTAANAVSSASLLIFADAAFNPLKLAAGVAAQAPPAVPPAPPAGPATSAYNWLKAQQKPTGLVESFENGGTAANLSVVYDEAVAAEAFLVKGDVPRARQVLSVLRALQQSDGGWYNIYNCNDLSVVEWHRDVGPAAWVALAVAKYEIQTGDTLTYHE